MGNALSPVELIKPLLNGGEEIHPVCDLSQRCVIGKFADGVEHKFLLCHGWKMEVSRLQGKGRKLTYLPLAAVALTVTGMNSFTTFPSLGLMNRMRPSSPAAARSEPSGL